MKYTREEVMEFIAEEDVKFIRLAFCDKRGVQKNIAIMPTELEGALTRGVPVDASDIEGFGGVIVLRPDTSTLTELPWRPQHGRVARFFCDVYDASGSLIASDPRNMLKGRESGATVGFDQTFYLMKLDEWGEPTDTPHDRAGYMDIAPADRGENVRREICLTLERMGIRPVGSHHGRGPGQHTVSCAPSDPVSAADNAVTFRAVVRTVAAQYGLSADFSPKPVAGGPKNAITLTINGEKQVITETDKNPYLLILESL